MGLIKLFDPFLIDNLAHLPDMCIFGLINEKDKKIFIGKTRNIVTYLSRLIKEYKYSNKELLKLPLIIIETITDKPNLWVRYNYWVNYYSNEGYLIYNKPRYRINCKLRIDLSKDFRMLKHTRHLFYVKIVSRHYKEHIIGVFDKIYDAESFISREYNNGIDNIVYSNNNLTKEYMEVK